MCPLHCNVFWPLSDIEDITHCCLNKTQIWLVSTGLKKPNSNRGYMHYQPKQRLRPSLSRHSSQLTLHTHKKTPAKIQTAIKTFTLAAHLSYTNQIGFGALYNGTHFNFYCSSILYIWNAFGNFLASTRNVSTENRIIKWRYPIPAPVGERRVKHRPQVDSLLQQKQIICSCPFNIEPTVCEFWH